MTKPFLKWSPATPIRKPDNLVSSTAKNITLFKPSYENDPKENMTFLMSNEYMRMWFKEKAVYDKDTYTRQQIIKDESKIKRRIIQRMMTYRKPSKNHFIDKNIQEKLGNDKLKEQKERDAAHDKMKFKPECPGKMGSELNQVRVKSKSKRTGNEASRHNKDNEDDECNDDDVCELVVRPMKCEQDE